jgi:cytochrome c556
MTNKKTLAMLFATACTLAAVLTTGPAAARFKKSEDAIDYRQSAFTIMSNHMGRLAAMAKGEIPFDAGQAQHSAQLIDTVAKLPWEAFVPGSKDKPANLKGDPWANAEDFKALQERLVGETAKLPAAAASLETLRKQVGATGAACKACHDKFREI